ncbi:hypothetical protein AAMO2058_001228000 [Amorphochlora amoebiformis]
MVRVTIPSKISRGDLQAEIFEDSHLRRQDAASAYIEADTRPAMLGSVLPRVSLQPSSIMYSMYALRLIGLRLRRQGHQIGM